MWHRITFGLLASVAVIAVAGSLSAAEPSGDYLEFRTCDVFTGPCFANSQTGLTGNEAVLAWSIDSGRHNGVDLAGLKAALVVRASDTLAFGGGFPFAPDPIRSMALIDSRASDSQKAALLSLIKTRAPYLTANLNEVRSETINISVDHIAMIGKLQAGRGVELTTRKLGHHDCVCTNEEVYYPPLVKVENAAPAFTVSGRMNASGVGSRWESPKTRSAFLATFGT